jgi:hypothetical protein
VGLVQLLLFVAQCNINGSANTNTNASTNTNTNTRTDVACQALLAFITLSACPRPSVRYRLCLDHDLDVLPKLTNIALSKADSGPKDANGHNNNSSGTFSAGGVQSSEVADHLRSLALAAIANLCKPLSSTSSIAPQIESESESLSHYLGCAASDHGATSALIPMLLQFLHRKLREGGNVSTTRQRGATECEISSAPVGDGGDGYGVGNVLRAALIQMGVSAHDIGVSNDISDGIGDANAYGDEDDGYNDYFDDDDNDDDNYVDNDDANTKCPRDSIAQSLSSSIISRALEALANLAEGSPFNRYSTI